MNEQEIINLIRDRLAIELDDDFGPGFNQYIKVKLWLNVGSVDNPKMECISQSELSIGKFS